MKNDPIDRDSVNICPIIKIEIVAIHDVINVAEPETTVKNIGPDGFSDQPTGLCA